MTARQPKDDLVATIKESCEVNGKLSKEGQKQKMVLMMSGGENSIIRLSDDHWAMVDSRAGEENLDKDHGLDY